MTSIAERIASKNLTISIELFPPKDEKGAERVLREMEKIHAAMDVAFTSVTYGAGGSTQEGTLKLVLELARRHPGRVVAHLTCIGATEARLSELLQTYQANGMQDILALRGDIPEGMNKEEAAAGGFHYAVDLVRWLRRRGGLDSIGVAAYPEGHPETPDKAKDLHHFAEKAAAGADYAMTQFFFENEDFARFRDAAAAAGVAIPIAPGIIPVRNLDQILRFAGMCGAKVPGRVIGALDPHREDPEAFKETSADLAAAQIESLIALGVPHVHIYALNQSDIILGIAERMGWGR
ncbi:MAG: methylenetetrahydrofolate reductase [bacterium]|nr:methylenetetrahydrofolate reductase [bacterium]